MALTPPITGIHQPNFLPWPGYFLKIALCDSFIFLDHVAIDFKGFTRRTQVLDTNHQITAWISVPLSPHTRTGIINAYTINEDLIQVNTLDTIKKYFTCSPFFTEVFPVLSDWILEAPIQFHLFNTHLIRNICEKLNINTTFLFSEDLAPDGNNADMNLDLVIKVRTGTYLSGQSGKKYLNEQDFNSNKIQLIYLDNLKLIKDYLAENNLNPMLESCSILEYLFQFGWAGTAEMIHRLKAIFYEKLAIDS